MKKVWILEKFLSRENLEKELEEKLATASELSASLQVPKEEYEKKYMEELSPEKYPDGKWVFAKGEFNYREFCRRVKEYLRLKTEEAASDLKKSLGKVGYSEDIKKMYRDTYAKVKNSYRVVEGEAEESEFGILHYTMIKENPGVYKFLWDTK